MTASAVKASGGLPASPPSDATLPVAGRPFAMKSSPVQIRNIALSYDGGRTQVLKDISLDIAAGEFFALLGPSGSGKSTLLRLIAGFNTAQSGQLLVGGEDITRVPPHQRNIGMVFQNYALWPHLTVRDNVAFGLVERRWSRADIDTKVAEMLALTGLEDYAARRPGQLSGGQQQRVALARTLAISPRVLLLDEPLSNLDAKLRVQMREELKRLQRRLGITTIFVTHDQEEALTTCDRIAVMDGGVVQQVGRPDQLYDDPVNRFVAEFIGTINLLPARVRPQEGDDAVQGEGIEHGVAASDATSEPMTRSLVSVSVEADVFGALRVPAATAARAAFTRGTRGNLALRPLAMHLALEGTPARPDDAVVSGIIEEYEFMGEFVRYRVRVADVALTIDQSHRAHTPVLAAGTRVRVAVSPREFRFLPG